MDNAFKYVILNKGIDTEASYPYNATTGKTCKFNATDIGATISNYTDIPRGSEMVETSEILIFTKNHLGFTKSFCDGRPHLCRY